MRVNCYSMEWTNRIEIVEKSNKNGDYIGIRFYLEMPVVKKNTHGQRSIHRGGHEMIDGDDDSSAVTFWAKKNEPQKLQGLLYAALCMLDDAYGLYLKKT